MPLLMRFNFVLTQLFKAVVFDCGQIRASCCNVFLQISTRVEFTTVRKNLSEMASRPRPKI